MPYLFIKVAVDDGVPRAFLAPVVAVALGATIPGESLGAGAAAGLLLILAGSWLSTDGRLPPWLAGAAGAEPEHHHARRAGSEAGGLRLVDRAAHR